MQEIDKLAWLYIKNKQILGARSKGKTTFYIPGGKREPGETDEEALIREIKEELSVDILSNTIAYANTFIAQADGKSDATQVKLTCYFGEFIGEIAADAEIEEVSWLSYKDKLKSSLVTQNVMEWLKSEGKIE